MAEFVHEGIDLTETPEHGRKVSARVDLELPLTVMRALGYAAKVRPLLDPCRHLLSSLGRLSCFANLHAAVSRKTRGCPAV
jgi:hypothetical protein